jgi:hypothetical protein
MLFFDCTEELQACDAIAPREQCACACCVDPELSASRSRGASRWKPRCRTNDALILKGSPYLSVVEAVAQECAEEDRQQSSLLFWVPGEEAKQWVGPKRSARHGNRFGALLVRDELDVRLLSHARRVVRTSRQMSAKASDLH